MLFFNTDTLPNHLKREDQMDIQKVRRENLRAAVKIAGNMTKLADKVDTSTSYLSQCLSSKIQKAIGPSMARRVEEALGFQKGWMDTPANLLEEEAEDQGKSANSLGLLIEQLNPSETDDLTEYVYMIIRKRKLEDKYK